MTSATVLSYDNQTTVNTSLSFIYTARVLLNASGVHLAATLYVLSKTPLEVIWEHYSFRRSKAIQVVCNNANTLLISYLCPTLPSKSHEYHYVVHLGFPCG